MSEDHADRIEAGIELLAEHLEVVEASAKAFLPVIKGFRRDLSLSEQACADHISAEFAEIAELLEVPPLENGGSFSELSRMLTLAESSLDGAIRIKHPAKGPEGREMRENLLKEVEVIHRNLLDVSDAARRLYESIQTAGFEFDVFNSKNMDANFLQGNILFDRDAFNLSMVTARAISERAIRMDIDISAAKRQIETGHRHAQV